MAIYKPRIEAREDPSLAALHRNQQPAEPWGNKWVCYLCLQSRDFVIAAQAD